MKRRRMILTISDRILILSTEVIFSDVISILRRNLNNCYMSALDKQEGGDHYKSLKIQPIEFIVANDIPFIEGNCIKYLCRHKGKGGSKDILKVIHYCELLLELEYGISPSKKCQCPPEK